jgi:hypothetical protein
MRPEQDVEWAAWTSQWQSIDREPAQALEVLTRRVRSRSRMFAVWVTAEAIVAAVGILWLVYRTVIATHVLDRMLMIALTVVCSVALAHAVWNWRGMWRIQTRSHQAFLDFSLLRCRRLRQAIRAGWALLAAQVICFVPWIVIREASYLFGFTLLGIVAAGAVSYLLAVARWVDREEEAIRAFGKALTEDPSSQRG